MAQKVTASVIITILVALFAWRNWPTTDSGPTFEHSVPVSEHVQVSFEKPPKHETSARDGIETSVYFAYRLGLSTMAQGVNYPDSYPADAIAQEQQRIIEQDLEAFAGKLISQERFSEPVSGQRYVLENYDIDDTPEKRMEVLLYQVGQHLIKVAAVWEVDRDDALTRKNMFFDRVTLIASTWLAQPHTELAD